MPSKCPINSARKYTPGGSDGRARMIKPRAQPFHKLVEPSALQQLVQPLIKWMPRRSRQLSVRNPNVFLFSPPIRLLIAMLAEYPAALWITSSFPRTYPDFHHGL